MEEKNLQVRYSVYNYDQVPSYFIDGGEVSVSCEEEADVVADDIIAEIEAVHSHRGYRYLMSVVLEEIIGCKYLMDSPKKLVKVYVDCL